MLHKGSFYLSNQNFQIWWLFRGMEVMKKYKIVTYYLTWGVNTSRVSLPLLLFIRGYGICLLQTLYLPLTKYSLV